MTFYGRSWDLLINLFENKVPIPIAKKTKSGMYLYGWEVIDVRLVNNGTIKSIPKIIINIESACIIPLLDTRYNPTTSGKSNVKTKPSNLSWVENMEYPLKKER